MLHKRRFVVYTVFLGVFLLLAPAVAMASGQSENSSTKASASAQNANSQAKKVTWKFAGLNPPATPESRAMDHLAKLVTERTNGAFTIHFYPAGQLGSSSQVVLENLRIDAVQLHGNVAGWNAQVVKNWNILAMPFLFTSENQIKAFQKSEVYSQMKAGMIKKAGIRVLADNWYRLPKALITKRPVTKISQLKGLKLRMPEIATYYKTWRALGADTVAIPWTEAYTAIQTGTVAGMDSPLNLIYGEGFYKVAPNVLETNHLMAPFDILVNEKAYESLPAAYRKVLDKAAIESGDYYTKIVKSAFEKDKQKMIADGVHFRKPDNIAVWRKRAIEVARQFDGHLWSKGLLEQVCKAVGCPQ